MSRLRELERDLARSAAISDIEMLCMWTETGSGGWYDTRNISPDDDPAYAEAIALAVEYLTLCGLLEFDPDVPTLVRIKPEARKI